MRRIMGLWLPQLPLDRRVRLGDPRVETVFAIFAEIKNAFRLTMSRIRPRPPACARG